MGHDEIEMLPTASAIMTRPACLPSSAAVPLSLFPIGVLGHLMKMAK